MKIFIFAVGKMKGADAELCAEYQKRLSGSITVKEIAAATQKTENEFLLKAIPPKAFVILCDERGKDLPSRELAAKFATWQERGVDLAFIIGGADGVTDEIRQRADFTICFGRATWPHRLVRIMLLEQLYRAQQINAGHPYHRDRSRG
jgi:23S rRNA (pseudouridine1915-N3)-methyltransferase